MGEHMKPHQNPAEFILEVTGAGIPKSDNKQQQQHEQQSEEGDGKVAEEGDVEMGEKTEKGENFYVDAYKESQHYGDTEQQLEAGIFPAAVRSLSLSFRSSCVELVLTSHCAQESVDDEEKSRWRKIKKRLTNRYASTYLQQFTQTMRRSFLAYWRSPEEFLQKVTVPLVLGVVIGTYFLQLNDTQQGASQRVSVIYFSLLVSNLLGIRTHISPLPLNVWA
jgi:hypothetical protein